MYVLTWPCALVAAQSASTWTVSFSPSKILRLLHATANKISSKACEPSLTTKQTAIVHETHGLYELSRDLSKIRSHSTFSYSLFLVYLPGTTGFRHKTPSARTSKVFYDCIIIGSLHHLPSHCPCPATGLLIQSLRRWSFFALGKESRDPQ
ncbi:hypothetical protein B0T12DRAFT_273484 [Alternaria alternata]|nr:hypothetical protein B0T12DRAFT_273484 [Alternaria alternata]